MEVVSESKIFFLIRLDPGEEVREKIEGFCAGTGIDTAWINGLGSCKEVELGYYNLEKKEYETRKFSEDLEIVSATGNIALKPFDDTQGRDAKPFLHVHGTFTRPSMEVIGGHIMRCVVSATCEVALWRAEGRVERKYDETTGLHLLCKI